MTDLDRLNPTDLWKFANNVITSWSPRDRQIARISRLRAQSWTVEVPKEFKNTAKTQHSSIPFDISTRAIGILTARDPIYERVPPGEEQKQAEAANTVERYFQARLAWDKKYAMGGRNSWDFLTDQIANKGAGCVGNIFAPHAYASAPPLTDEKGDYLPKFWRDGTGKATEDRKNVDLVATSRAYVKAVELYRMGAEPPMEHRYLPTEQVYPYFVGRQLLAMVVRRKASIMELAASLFRTDALGKGDTDGTVEKTFELTEVWTPNRCQYFIDKEPLPHKVYGSDGIETGYGFVPYVYRTGMPGTEEVEYGPAGLPLLELVASNIVMIDTLLTFRLNALEGFSFPAWQVIRDAATETLASLASGQPKAYDIPPGQAIDFGTPGVRIEPLLHPGLNKDFDKAIEDERAEIRKIIPDVLFGIPANSGYNSAIMTEQARAFFNPMIGCQEYAAEAMAVLDMRHISDRLPGATYLEYREKTNDRDYVQQSVRRKLSRIGISGKDIAEYFGIHAEIGRELDRVTMGTWAAGMVEKGLMARQTAAEICGVTDWEREKKLMAIDRFLAKPEIQTVIEADAVREFGMEQEQEAAAAMARLQTGPDGTPLVMMPDGTSAGPGASPEGQAMNGAILGGMNGAVTGPNLAATNNPSIGLPTLEQPAPSRRRGGAIPGGPQNQGGRKRVKFGP